MVPSTRIPGIGAMLQARHSEPAMALRMLVVMHKVFKGHECAPGGTGSQLQVCEEWDADADMAGLDLDYSKSELVQCWE